MVSRAILNGWPLVPPSAVPPQGGGLIPPIGYRVVLGPNGNAQLSPSGNILIKEAA